MRIRMRSAEKVLLGKRVNPIHRKNGRDSPISIDKRLEIHLSSVAMERMILRNTLAPLRPDHSDGLMGAREKHHAAWRTSDREVREALRRARRKLDLAGR